MGSQKFGSCQRNNSLEKCLTPKCYFFNVYNGQGLPCFYFMPPNRGFEGDVESISGTKIRRQYFNWVIVLFSIMFSGVFLTLAIKSIYQNKAVTPQLVSILSDFLLCAVTFIAPPAVLSFLNSRFFGKCICVINIEGLYCNQKFLPWNEIELIEFMPVVPSRVSTKCSYAVIFSANEQVMIPHAPHLLLREVKKFRPDIKTKFSIKSLLL